MFFFFNDTATTEIYTLSLHDALPIWMRSSSKRRKGSSIGTEPVAMMTCLAWYEVTAWSAPRTSTTLPGFSVPNPRDRKSTRLNSSHANISYAVFCLKKKNYQQTSHHK